MLTMKLQDSLVIETDETRERAQALLDELLRTRAEVESQREQSNRSDPMSIVTGRSSLDNAIERTRSMVHLLEQTSRALREGLTSSLTPAEREILEEIDAEVAAGR
ncbi:MAG: hypothetical protein H6813_01860 [Phycisphaeraceae bacterium]|nr:hypothetical protein [Phycisphaeraceae bacterium]